MRKKQEKAASAPELCKCCAEVEVLHCQQYQISRRVQGAPTDGSETLKQTGCNVHFVQHFCHFCLHHPSETKGEGIVLLCLAFEILAFSQDL